MWGVVNVAMHNTKIFPRMTRIVRIHKSFTPRKIPAIRYTDIHVEENENDNLLPHLSDDKKVTYSHGKHVTMVNTTVYDKQNPQYIIDHFNFKFWNEKF